MFSFLFITYTVKMTTDDNSCWDPLADKVETLWLKGRRRNITFTGPLNPVFLFIVGECLGLRTTFT